MSNETIRRLRRAAAERSKAELRRRNAADNMRKEIRAAKAEGVPIAQIARETGLSRQGVYELLGQQPS